MGEILRFTTWSKHRNVFHKITSDSFAFDIKGTENAAIGLSDEPGNECEIWILIGFREHCWIRKSCEKYRCVYMPDSLSRYKYNKFWITMLKNKINLGRDDEPIPVLTFQNQKRNLYYVTFTVLGETNYLKWKCYLPPQIENPTLLKITGGEPHWVKMTKTDKVPNNALIGGHENGVLYIIRAHHLGSLMPGKLVPNLGLAYLSMGGFVFEKEAFEVLCGYNYTWMKIEKNRIPLGAIPGGYYNESHDILYIGRGYCTTGVIPGKIHPSRDVCYISYNGIEVTCQNYEILVTPHINRQSFQDCYYAGLDLKNGTLFNNSDRAEDSDDDDVGAAGLYKY